MALDPSQKARLNWRAVEHFQGDTLFDRIARTVCEAGCLPRKELYEAWEVARRLRRRFRGGRIVDVAAGHGLLAYICLLLDDTSPEAICVDIRKPPSAELIAAALESAWPRLQGRVTYLEQALATVPIQPTDILVSAHACGALTDEVLDHAIAVRASVAVLPCCHDLKRANAGPLAGWLEGSLAMDVNRAMRLQAAGYKVWTQTIPVEITPKHRLLLGQPAISAEMNEPCHTVAIAP